MSKIRTVKPEFWSSEQIAQCSPTARLLFIGLWNFCDDFGIHPASTTRLKMEVFPGDNYSSDDIKNWVDELLQVNLLITYKAEDDKEYWQVTGWHHQRIDRPYYKYPQPSVEHNPHHVQAVIKQCPNSVKALPQPLSKGKEGIGEYKRQVDKSTQPVFVSQDVEETFKHWQDTMSHPKAKLDKKRSDKITKALLSYSLDDLKQAIDGCKQSKFHMGQNETNTKHDGIDIIFRDAEHIEKFMGLASPPIQTTPLALDY